jgi:hypothetical protein
MTVRCRAGWPDFDRDRDRRHRAVLLDEEAVAPAAHTEGAHVFAWLAVRSGGRALVFCDGRLAELRGIARPPRLTCGLPGGSEATIARSAPARVGNIRAAASSGHACRWCYLSSNATIASVIAASSSSPVKRLLGRRHGGRLSSSGLVARASQKRAPNERSTTARRGARYDPLVSPASKPVSL